MLLQLTIQIVIQTSTCWNNMGDLFINLNSFYYHIRGSAYVLNNVSLLRASLHIPHKLQSLSRV